MKKQHNSTEFENKVWQNLKRVPRGRVTTYKALAEVLGYFRAARAVGNALSKNPWAPKVPCHRAVKSNGQIGGYRSGIRKKTVLLKSEGVRINDGIIVDFKKILYKF